MEGSAAAMVLTSIDSSTNNATHARHAGRLKPRIDREPKPIIEPLLCSLSAATHQALGGKTKPSGSPDDMVRPRICISGRFASASLMHMRVRMPACGHPLASGHL